MVGPRSYRLPLPRLSVGRSPRQRRWQSARLRRRNHPTLLPSRVWKPGLATTPLQAAVLPSFLPPVALAALPPSFPVPSGVLVAVHSLLVLPLLATLLPPSALAAVLSLSVLLVLAALLPPSAIAVLLSLLVLPLLAALLPPSALAALRPLALRPLLATLLPPSVLAALLLLALLPLPAALLTPLPLAAFPPLALGLPLLPRLVPLLLELLVSWVPLFGCSLGAIPSTLVSNTCLHRRRQTGQGAELVPHSSPSARPQRSQFLLQWLRRPLGDTQCPHFNPDSPLAHHNLSKVTSQQCRGFHPTSWMHCQQKKAMNPQSVELVPHSSPSVRPQWSQFLLQWLRRPLGVHIMPSLQPGLPISRSQPFKCHQSAVQRFSPYQLDALQAKKGNEPPKRRTCPSQFSECPSPMVPIPSAVAAAPPGVHSMPSLQPGLPIGKSQLFKCHQSVVQRFSPY